MLRVVSTDAPAWFDSSDFERVVADDAAPRATARSPRSAASATSARATASTRSGSSARPRMSSRSSRSTRSTRSTSPTRRSRACSDELELPGYSAYLHPIGADLLLGIGQDVDDRGPAARHAALALRRLRPPAPDAARSRDARPGLVRGGVRPPRLPLLAAHRPRRRAVRPARGRLPRRRARRGSTLVGRITHPTRDWQPRSGVPSWSAAASSRSRTRASPRTASRTLAAQGWAPFPQSQPTPVPIPGLK